MTPRPIDPKLFAKLERASLDQTLAGIPLNGGLGASAARLSPGPGAPAP